MKSDKAERPPSWPVSAMLAYGTLGGGHPAAHRYHVRSGLALGLFVACMLAAHHFRASLPADSELIVTAIAPGATFVYIVWEFRRYLMSLDELARRVQFESIVWTYLTGLALAAIFGGVGLITHWTLNPLWFMVLEPVRVAWLYVISRRY